MTELMVALDVQSAHEAEVVMTELSGLPVIFKVGLELFVRVGPEWVKTQTARGRRIFLDLKFHDIPNTVLSAIRSAGELGVHFLTLHMANGTPFLAALEKNRSGTGEKPSAAIQSPRLLGVTVLTSFSDESWAAWTQLSSQTPLSVEASALNMARLAHDSSLGGIVCSAKELKAIKGLAPDLYCVVPGIRPAGTSAQDQARVVTPGEASRMGADAIVVGRPILQAKSKREMTEQILTELKEAAHDRR